MQDDRGYIWVGTIGGGISIFDGYDFQTLTTKQGLAGDEVRSIFQASSGSVWIGTNEGVSVHDGHDITNISSDNGLNGSILCFHEHEDGSVWAGGDDGLYRIEVEADSFKVKRYSQVDGLSNNFIFDIEPDSKGRLWLATYYGGINIMTLTNDSVSFKWLRGGIEIPSDLVISLEPFGDTIMWAGSYDEGAFELDYGDHEPRVNRNFALLSQLGDNTVWDIQEDRHGTLWFATNSKGLKRLDSRGFKSFSEENGLPNNQLLSILEDREGNLWIGTNGSGIALFSGDYLEHYTEESSLEADQIYQITEDARGRIILASYGAGVAILDNGSTTYLNTDNGLAGDLVSGVDVDSAGNIWIATDKGICKYDGRSFDCIGEKDGLVSDQVNSVLVDRDGVVWCGTKFGVSAKWKDQILTLTTDQGLIDNTITDLMEDKQGNIWMSTLGGLVKYDKQVLQTFDEVEGLTFKKIHDICEGPDGDLWISTNGGGLFRLDVQSSDSVFIHPVSSAKPLSTSAYTAIEFLNDTTIVAGYSRGFDKLIVPLGENASIEEVIHSDKSDGFIALETNLGALFKDSHDRMWFGTPIGATVYDPSIEPEISGEPIVHITDVKLFYESVDWSSYTTSLLDWTSLPQQLELSYSEKQLTFDYTGISLHNTDKLVYRHFLEGVDANWSPPKRDRQVTYSGLSPGEYIFRVVAIDRTGKHSQESSFSFRINPPWYQTTWFYLTSLGTIILLVILFIRWREMKLKEENEHLERVVEERTAEVVEQKEEIERKNQDITDSINYARKIQEAILPRRNMMESYLKDHFVIFRPKDIVSGDFYWFNEHQGKMIFTAADCTGHGVPGAFMSMIGTSLLNDAVNEKDLTQPDLILNEVRDGVITAMQQTGAEGEQKDGMDMALCTYDSKKKLLQYAGANNSLYVVRKSGSNLKYVDGNEVGPAIELNGISLFEVKPNKMPVGYYSAGQVPFTNHELKVEEGDCVYSFSDGYADQFGGPKGKKFMYGKMKKLLMSMNEENMSSQKAELLATIDAWMGDEHEQIDDICFVGIRV